MIGAAQQCGGFPPLEIVGHGPSEEQGENTDYYTSITPYSLTPYW